MDGGLASNRRKAVYSHGIYRCGLTDRDASLRALAQGLPIVCTAQLCALWQLGSVAPKLVNRPPCKKRIWQAIFWPGQLSLPKTKHRFRH